MGYSSKGILRIIVGVDEIRGVIEEIGRETNNLEFKKAGKKFKNKYQNTYLRKDLICYVEYPYVDLVYRDTFYKFHSTKIDYKEKDCIRLSFFDAEIDQNHFSQKTLSSACENNDYFLGCLIIRPTKINPFGRVIFSPKIYSKNLRHLILREYKFQINGSELRVKAFPNSGQDSEYQSCAETTIMNVLNYFSKYDNFNSKLPSEITSLVDKIRSDRVTPTDGLLKEEISLILKQCGFGTKIYTKSNYGSVDLKKILNDYVESGIPVITLLSNNNSYHATIAIGHENVDDLKQVIFPNPTDTNFTIIDSSEFYKDKKYIFIDDNYPSYQHATFEKPAVYYKNKFKDATIKVLIIPLDKRIYLDSLRVRNIFSTIFDHSSHFINKRVKEDGINPYIVKYCLTTSNALKKQICSNEKISLKVKNAIEGLILPKFVWLIQISDTENYKNGQVKGFIVIDGSGAKHIGSIIAIVWVNVLKLGNGLGKSSEKIDDYIFSIYDNNLIKY